MKHQLEFNGLDCNYLRSLLMPDQQKMLTELAVERLEEKDGKVTDFSLISWKYEDLNSRHPVLRIECEATMARIDPIAININVDYDKTVKVHTRDESPCPRCANNNDYGEKKCWSCELALSWPTRASTAAPVIPKSSGTYATGFVRVPIDVTVGANHYVMHNGYAYDIDAGFYPAGATARVQSRAQTYLSNVPLGSVLLLVDTATMMVVCNLESEGIYGGQDPEP